MGIRKGAENRRNITRTYIKIYFQSVSFFSFVSLFYYTRIRIFSNQRVLRVFSTKSNFQTKTQVRNDNNAGIKKV